MSASLLTHGIKSVARIAKFGQAPVNCKGNKMRCSPYIYHHTFANMSALISDAKPNLLLSILQNKCPRCRRGSMFKAKNPYNLRTTMQMHDACPVCKQPLDMEPGFYYGTNMISYALAILFSVVSFFAWWLIIGFSLSDERFFWWIGINAVLLVLLQPSLMRLSRAVWIAIFVHYSHDWESGDIIMPERVNKEQMNNW